MSRLSGLPRIVFLVVLLLVLMLLFFVPPALSQAYSRDGDFSRLLAQQQ